MVLSSFNTSTKVVIPKAQNEFELEQAVRSEQLRLVYRNGPTGIAINVINALIVAAVIWTQMPHSLMVAWLAVIGVVALARMGLVWRYRHARESELDSKQHIQNQD